ncbi:unnamed protein product [Polarella glacialis]|uniref:G domain-containing protein n=1 Tax=Polarella glacialis TaxID=89957 RepID=A0A813FQD0_POLGL|nr:unnamed protein product [Polarella glacialis]
MEAGGSGGGASSKRTAVDAGLSSGRFELWRCARRAAPRSPASSSEQAAPVVAAPVAAEASAGDASQECHMDGDAQQPVPTASQGAPCETKHKVFLVVGECGDGKSTLINALRDPENSGEASAGLNSRGVTKTITAYVGLPINGQPIDLLDTPGVGDTDVTPMKLLTLIEQELLTDEIGGADAIDGVIVTTPIPDGRVKLGAQLVQMLVEHGFLGEEKWRNIILVGTKVDRATAEEIDLFRTDEVDELGRPKGIASQFFSPAPGGKGTCVMTHKGDYSELREAILRLPSLKVKYGTPDAARMAEVFSEKLGIDKSLFQKELVEARQQLQIQLDAQFEEKEILKRDMEQLKEERARDLEVQEQRASVQSLELKQELKLELEAKLKEKDRLLEELRTSGPQERLQLESQMQMLESRFSELQEKAAQKQRSMEVQLDQKKEELRALIEQQRQQQESYQRARNYDFGAAKGASSSCLHLKRQCSWVGCQMHRLQGGHRTTLDLMVATVG